MPRVRLRGQKLLSLPKRYRRDHRSAQQAAAAKQQAEMRTRERTVSFYARTKQGKARRRKKK